MSENAQQNDQRTHLFRTRDCTFVAWHPTGALIHKLPDIVPQLGRVDATI